MSISVSYYSFSPSRADKKWAHFVEDFTVLRRRYAPRNAYRENREKKIAEAWKKRELLHEKYAPILRDARQEIFTSLKSKGLMIPWVEWDSEEGVDKYGRSLYMTDEQKMNYLLEYGTLYPRGTDLTDKDRVPIMLHTHFPEMLKAYQQLENEYNDTQLSYYKDLDSHTSDLQDEDTSIVLSKRQAQIDGYADYLESHQKYDKNLLLDDLQWVDLRYGSVEGDLIEEGKAEFETLNIIVDICAPNKAPESLSRSEWLALFEGLRTDSVKKIIESVGAYCGWDYEYVEFHVLNILMAMKPVMADMKKESDAIFVRAYDGMDGINPDTAACLFVDRAKQHAKEFKGSLPPVL